MGLFSKLKDKFSKKEDVKEEKIQEKYEEENGWYFVWCDDKPAFVLGSDIQFN